MFVTSWFLLLFQIKYSIVSELLTILLTQNLKRCKMKIKIATFRSALKYSENFLQQQKDFLQAIQKAVDLPIETAALDDYDCDLKLIFVQTGGSEGLFLQNFAQLQPPYYLLTNGANNSLAASLEILTYLKNRQLEGEVLHGDTDHIARRITQLCKLGKARKKLADMRLGMIGKPSDWLIASVPDYAAVRKLFGTEIEDIDLAELENMSKTMHPSQKQLPDGAFDKSELESSLNIYECVKQIVEKHRLDGFALRCFDLLSDVKMTGCMALAFLNSENTVATCEGDLMAMLSMCVLRTVCGKPSFQANPSRIETAENSVVFAHCTLPLSMTESFKLDTHFESGIGVAVRGKMHVGDVTVLRLSSDLKHYFLSSGQITGNLEEDNLCRTQIRVHLDEDVKLLLQRPCGNHHVICYGNCCDSVEMLLDSYGLVRVR